MGEPTLDVYIGRILERAEELPNEAEDDLYHMLTMALLLGIAEKEGVDMRKFENAGFGKPRKENREVIYKLLDEVRKELGLA